MAKAIRFSRYGGPEVLELVEVPDPAPGPGQVRVAVRAIGVNPYETKVRRGLMSGGEPPAKPRGLGDELAGVVDEVGPGVGELKVGDEVFGTSSGPAYGEYALADETKVVAKPATVPWEVAGGAPQAASTAFRTLGQLGVGDGDVLLIHAAAGGVGICAAQIARDRGATVIGTASERNHEFLRSLGVTPVSYGDGLADRIRALAPDGVDAVLDASGRGEIALSVELAGGPERVITIAAPDAAEHGVRFSSGDDPAFDARAALEATAAMLADGRLVVPIWRTFPLEQAAAAHAESESGHLLGKIVLLPS